ncbi:MAG TPA: lipid-binding SYLF domain-containing protein, partial [Lysobacter sp.]
MSRLPRLAALVVSLSLATAAVAGPQEDERARQAVRVLTDIQQIPESAIPDKLLDEARGIVVVPDSLKVGLVLGGRRGHGLLSVKNPDGTWSSPSFVKLTGGSIGFQAGVQSADIVLVFRSDRGLDSIVNGKVTLGADAGVAAGPVGRNASTATDGQLKAEIWSWSRARGLFAGIALDGAVLSIDDAANQLAYGEGSTPRMIFEGRTAQ